LKNQSIKEEQSVEPDFNLDQNHDGIPDSMAQEDEIIEETEHSALDMCHDDGDIKDIVKMVIEQIETTPDNEIPDEMQPIDINHTEVDPTDPIDPIDPTNSTDPTDPIVGEPEEDMEHWHMQEHDDTCAVVSQEYILEELTGEEFSEEELRQEAIDKGYYIPGGGTPCDDVGKLLEDHGIEVERTEGNTLEDLREKLEQGEKVIVGVDSDEIWYPNQSGEEDLNEHGNIPGQDANHAVQVIGIDYSDPDNPVVILNDPGSPDGQGRRIPADEFMDAWEDSDCYMVATTGETSFA
jgi:Peptidase_C39 like family